MAPMTLGRMARASLAGASVLAAALIGAAIAGWLSPLEAILFGCAAISIILLGMLVMAQRLVLRRLDTRFGALMTAVARRDADADEGPAALDRTARYVEESVRGALGAAGEDRAEYVAVMQRLMTRLDELRPPSGGSTADWFHDPTVINAVRRHLRGRPADTIVSCGAGGSLVRFAYFCNRLRARRVVVLETDHARVRESRAHLEAHGLDALVEIRHAPLVTNNSLGATGYDDRATGDLTDVALLLVEEVLPVVRDEAGPALLSTCANGALVVLPHGSSVGSDLTAERWQKQWPSLTAMLERQSADVLILDNGPLPAV